MWLVRFILTFCLLSAVSAKAQVNMPDPHSDIPLSEAELTAVFKGQTHRGTYGFKRVNFKSFGFEETTTDDGGVRHIQDGHLDTGTYTIKNNLICFSYDENERGEFSKFNPICFNIYQRGNCYYHYQHSVRNNKSVRGFTARSIIKGDNPNCAPQIS